MTLCHIMQRIASYYDSEVHFGARNNFEAYQLQDFETLKNLTTCNLYYIVSVYSCKPHPVKSVACKTSVSPTSTEVGRLFLI